MINQKLACLIVVISIHAVAFSQQKEMVSSGNGNVQVIKDYRLDLLAERINKTDEVKGFRIQIHSGLRKEAARKVKSQFLLLYPETSSYEIYQQPNFIVKVGNFLTKLEAQYFLNNIREKFPNSFIVPDDINPLNLRER